MYLADWIIIATLLAVAVVDIIFVVVKTPISSRRIMVIGKRLSLAPYVWGALGGHFLGVAENPLLSPTWISLAYLIVLGVTLAGIHWIWWEFFDAPDWLPLIHLLIGCGMGAVLIPT